MHRALPDAANQAPLIDPHVVGTACGLFSAFVYTCANAFLRAVSDYDPVWVSAIKAIPTVVAMSPVLAVMAFRGQRVTPSPGALAAIVVGGLVGQLGGNISFQWALGEIGVALTVPLSLGGMIVGAAVLGRIFLHEPVTPLTALALALLITAICFLSGGAREAREAVAAPAPPMRVAAGVTVACLSGVAYSVLNVILRYHVTRGMPWPTILFSVSVAGLISLTGIAWARIGPHEMFSTSLPSLGLMLAAGACNTVAFVSLTKSLHLTSVVWVNALNATQAMLAALAGVLIFHEPLSPWLALGVGLTIAGLLLLARAHRALRAVEIV